MTWRDRFLSDRIGEHVVAAIDAYPLLLPIFGIDVSAGFVETKPGSMGSFPVITIVLEKAGGDYPANTAVPEKGWVSGYVEVCTAVWRALDSLADEVAPK